MELISVFPEKQRQLLLLSSSTTGLERPSCPPLLLEDLPQQLPAMPELSFPLLSLFSTAQNPRTKSRSGKPVHVAGVWAGT